MLETTEIVDPRAAAVFAAPRQRRILLALIPEEQCLTQLARLTDTPLNLLHHHTRKFMRLGLVRITREEARAGAPIKYYRATAQTFFVPAELMEADPGAGMASQLRALLEKSLDSSLKGVNYSHDGAGPRMRVVKDPGRIATELWLNLRLSDVDAAALAGELRDLLHRYQARSCDGQGHYVVHAAIAPA